MNRRHHYIHLGLVAFGVRGLTRQRIGAKVLIILYDSRFSDKEKSIIGLAEVDMNTNLGITYICPNFNMTIRDFTKHIKIVVQALGYGDFLEKNINLDVVFLGKTMNNISNNYKVQIDGIIASLSSRGIQFIKPRQYSSEELAGLEWTIQLEENTPKLLQPSDSVVYKDNRGRLSIRFSNYLPSPSNPQEDEETANTSIH